MPFLSELVLQETRGHVWRLKADLVYRGSIETFTVPQHFVTDLASVPQIFLWLVPRSGRYTKAAVLHDWLCREAAANRIRRFDADGIFRRVMREEGVSKARRSLIWAGVRLGAWRTFFQGGEGDRSSPWWHVLAITILVLALPAVGVAGLAVLFLFGFWLVEWATYGIERLRGQRGDRPVFTWSDEPIEE